MPSPSSSRQDRLRKLPAVDSLLEDPELVRLAVGAPRTALAEAVRQAVAEARQGLLDESAEEPDEDALRRAILARAADRARLLTEPQYRRAINATGVILHTGLGRAVLPRAALEHFVADLSGYSLLQLDLDTGRRGRRDKRIERLLCHLTGAEAATVVNNNAAATALALSTIASGKEVIVSRGQLVEIGGSFRLPEVMAASGAKLVEVGTTNKTHARDYEAAITENTAAIMRVHPSNYRIVGFTAEVPLAMLERIAHVHGLVLFDDLGAGALLDFSRFGFSGEPRLADSIATGADLVCSSADKLIGGSQGGILLGRAKWVEAARKNPLARIVRCGKLSLAAIEATLALFLDEEQALGEVPTLRMLSRSVDELAEQAQRIAAALTARAAAEVDLIEGSSRMGSGSLPTQDLPTRLVAIAPHAVSAEALARRLRLHHPPIVARVQDDRVLVDPRTLLMGEEPILVDALATVLGRDG